MYKNKVSFWVLLLQFIAAYKASLKLDDCFILDTPFSTLKNRFVNTSVIKSTQNIYLKLFKS